MRAEYKYFVPMFQLPVLQSLLRPFVQPDRFSAGRPGSAYTVRSIYFDDAQFQMYHSKRLHLAHRMKVRMRSYNMGNDDSLVFLEIKRKYQQPIVKNRAALPLHAIKSIFRGAPIDEFLPQTHRSDDVRRFFYQIFSKNLRPVVNVIYEREAYTSQVIDPTNDLRITLDKNLRSVPLPGIDELFVERNIRYALDNQFIMEIKFNNYCPAWVKPIIAELNLQKTPASKYVLAIESQPAIPTSRTGWLMGRFFDAP